MCYVTTIFGQLKVYDDGRVKVYRDRTIDDANEEISMQVYGKHGTMLTNGRIAIGDYGKTANNGANVFLGEYGSNEDTDQLQLHGKKGVYLTYGKGNTSGNVIGYYDTDEEPKFNFNCDVYSNGIKLKSDKRLKKR